MMKRIVPAKEEVKKNINALHSIITKSVNNKPQTHLTGFVASPKDKLPSVQQHADIQISGGRLKDGGYVAYPKK